MRLTADNVKYFLSNAFDKASATAYHTCHNYVHAVIAGAPMTTVAEMCHTFWRGAHERWDIQNRPGWDETGRSPSKARKLNVLSCYRDVNRFIFPFHLEFCRALL